MCDPKSGVAKRHRKLKRRVRRLMLPFLPVRRAVFAVRSAAPEILVERSSCMLCSAPPVGQCGCAGGARYLGPARHTARCGCCNDHLAACGSFVGLADPLSPSGGLASVDALPCGRHRWPCALPPCTLQRARQAISPSTMCSSDHSVTPTSQAPGVDAFWKTPPTLIATLKPASLCRQCRS